MGLKLKLKPFERFVVNGVVIENGRHRNTVTVANHAQVMTGRSIMQQEEANTPVKRTYFAIQLMLLEPQKAKGHKATFNTLITQLADAIHDPTMRRHLADAVGQVDEGDYYKALAALRPVIAYEAKLLEPQETAIAPKPIPSPSEAAVGA